MKKSQSIVILSILVFFTASFAGSIESASHQQISLIKQGFFEPVTIFKSAAVLQSNDRYYVGLNFLAKGYETRGIGIWIVAGDKHNPSKAYSVNAVATLFSGFVNANQAQLAASMSDPESKRILNFLKKK